MSKTLSIIPGIILMFALSACSSLPAWMGGANDTLEALAKAKVPGAYTATFDKDGKVVFKKTWDCTVEAGQTLPECRLRPAAPVPPNAAITPVK